MTSSSLEGESTAQVPHLHRHTREIGNLIFTRQLCVDFGETWLPWPLQIAFEKSSLSTT